MASTQVTRFASDLIRALGGKPTAAGVRLFLAQQAGEGGWTNNDATYNPLNLTAPGSGLPTINSVGVVKLPSYQEGVSRTARLIASKYPELARELRTGRVNFNNPSLQADLNQWVSGNHEPGASKYVSGIASRFGQTVAPALPSSALAAAAPATSQQRPQPVDKRALFAALVAAEQTGNLAPFLTAAQQLHQQPAATPKPTSSSPSIAGPGYTGAGADPYHVGRYGDDPVGTAAYKTLGTPHAGTHTLGNWQSDNAYDLGVPVGTPVYAPSAGTIDAQHYGRLASSGRFEGMRVNLYGGRNAYYLAHLSRLVVKPGQKVKAGDLIGYSGAANGVPHLHYGIGRL